MRKHSNLMLALDTSTQILGISLYDGAQVISENIWFSKDHHTIQLIPAIENTINKCGFKMADIGAISVALGPGSFTGLRIGLAAGKGLAHSARIPVIGIPSLEALAASQSPTDMPVIAVLKAGRKRLAVAEYLREDDQMVMQKELKTLVFDELLAGITSPALLCGEFDAEQRAILNENSNVTLASPARSIRRPSFIAEIAWHLWQDPGFEEPEVLTPIYLHFQNPNPA